VALPLEKNETKRLIHTPVSLSFVRLSYWTNFSISWAFVKVAKITLGTFGNCIQSSYITT